MQVYKMFPKCDIVLGLWISFSESSGCSGLRDMTILVYHWMSLVPKQSKCGVKMHFPQKKRERGRCEPLLPGEE